MTVARETSYPQEPLQTRGFGAATCDNGGTDTGRADGCANTNTGPGRSRKPRGMVIDVDTSLPRARTEEHKRSISEATRAHWAANPRPKTPLWERILRHRKIAGACWEWTGFIHSGGYGLLKPSAGEPTTFVHRLSYEINCGPIPNGYEIDHLCRNRKCFNPDHLEAVTPRVNVLRSNAPSAITVRTGFCQRGHEMTPANTYVRVGGKRRMCRECIRMRKRKAWVTRDRVISK